ncbi:PVC-type heme-binding CxxCH protein [Verrucomicrobiaceae bacterium 227]
MISKPLFLLGASLISVQAQQGLRDIPDPDPVKQAAAFNLPEGMEINLFASDPMIAKPVQMNWDTEGRLWLVSSGMYPHIVPGSEENDSVLILEDTDGDGVADKKTVFADDLHIPTAVMPADGGAYVANSTEILFLKDTDGDGVADERKVVLSGFGTEDTHHLVHTFEQGPDGMLYFLQSIYIHSHLETPHGVRRLMGGGVWHLRPETQQAEVLSKGLVNPWGFVFDDYGQTFATDGAGGQGINYIFPRSVFVTSPGAKRVVPGLNPGQPKLCGLEILSGSHVPESLRGIMIAPDFRGHRINSYRLSPNGSSYTSTQLPDFLSSSHRAFRPIDVKMGPDGAVYISDWYNPIIQHGEVDFRDKRRDHTRGRIWRVTFKDQALAKSPDYKNAKTEDLLEMQISPEKFVRESARRELRERGPSKVLPLLQAWIEKQSLDSTLLEGLWTLQALNTTDAKTIEKLLAAKDPRYRSAALRVLYHRSQEVPESTAWINKAINDDNPQVRLWAISCLAQNPGPDSVPTALQALDHPMDPTLDFALWSIVREHEEHWVPAFQNSTLDFDGKLDRVLFAIAALEKPLTLDPIFAALSKGSLDETQKHSAISVIAKIGTPVELERLLVLMENQPELRNLVLDSLISTAELRKLKPANNRSDLLKYLDPQDPAIFKKAAKLAGLWKLEQAKEKLSAAFENPETSAASRTAAADGLKIFGGSEAIQFFEEHTGPDSDESIRSLAVRELATLDPNRAAKAAISLLKKDDGSDQLGLFGIFLRNPAASTALAKALAEETLPAKVAATGLQRAGTSGNPPQDLIDALQKSGDLKPMNQTLSAEQMATMVDRVQREGNASRGESVYRRGSLQCIACHAIGGVGAPIGPDLISIGSSAPVDYLVTSLLAPNDKIKEGYHTTLITLKNGDAHTGSLINDGDNDVTLRDYSGGTLQIAKADIASTTISPVSLMPPGLTAGLREDEFIDLVRFLSELGKEGDFKTEAKPLIRNWSALQPHDRTRDIMGHYGPKIFAERFDGYQWTPVVSKVNGELPPEELPKVLGRGRNHWGVVRFGLDPSAEGELQLKINDTHLMHLFDGEKEIPLPEKGAATLKIQGGGGSDRFTLAVNSAYRPAPILVEVIQP